MGGLVVTGGGLGFGSGGMGGCVVRGRGSTHDLLKSCVVVGLGGCFGSCDWVGRMVKACLGGCFWGVRGRGEQRDCVRQAHKRRHNHSTDTHTYIYFDY